MTTTMRKRIMALPALVLAAAVLCGTGTGCDDDNGSGTDYNPSVEVSGTWDVLLDGDPLGAMTIEVTDNGKLTGSLTTTEGAEAELDGVMDDRTAEFTVVFTAEAYLATITFNENAITASGVLVDNKGYSRVMSCTRRFDVEE